MSVAFNDWRNQTDEKLKYQMYLCSPEWGRLREQVRQRANGKCERCGLRDMDAVHHIHYANKYNEKMEDLRSVCNECHDVEHGRKQENLPRIYMAGKIRDAFYEDWRPIGWSLPYETIRSSVDWATKEFNFHMMGIGFRYVGPFQIARWHGEQMDGPHSTLDKLDLDHGPSCGGKPATFPRMLQRNCFLAIQSSDVVLVGLSKFDRESYGTHVEVGLAFALGKPVAIMVDEPCREQWFMYSFSRVFAEGKTLNEFLKHDRAFVSSVWDIAMKYKIQSEHK